MKCLRHAKNASSSRLACPWPPTPKSSTELSAMLRPWASTLCSDDARSRVVLPCKVTFGPSRTCWCASDGTMASADFRSAPSYFRMHGPAFRASSTHGYADRISPDKNVMYPRPNATSTCTPSSDSASRCQARSPRVIGLTCGFCSYPGGSW